MIMIMSNMKGELSTEELKRIEYEQICEDWRNRDSMLWQSLAVAITLTGAVFVAAFNKDMPWIFRPILFLLSFLLNSVLLLKIVKDHYYQLGSGYLLSKLGDNKLKEYMQINPEKCETPENGAFSSPIVQDTQINPEKCEFRPLRIYELSTDYFEQLKKKGKIPFPFVYERLKKRSAFKGFFWIQLILVIISLVYFFISLA